MDDRYRCKTGIATAHELPIVCYAPAPGNFEGYEIPYGISVGRGNEKAFISAAVGCVIGDGS